MKHTTAPWTLYDDGPDGSDIVMAHVDGDNYDIAEMSTERPPEERKANAQLIAAAPALLEMCKRLRHSIRHAANCKAPLAFSCTCDANQLWDESRTVIIAAGGTILA